MTSDELRALMRGCRRGEEDSARRLHAHVAPRLTAYARSLTGDAEAAEDAVQEALLRLVREPFWRVARVRDPMAWLAARVRGAALTGRRSAARSRARETDRGHTRAERSFAPDADGLEDAVAALDPDLREVVVLKHASELTFDQIALALGQKRGTVAWRYGKALDLLREALHRIEMDDRKERLDVR